MIAEPPKSPELWFSWFSSVSTEVGKPSHAMQPCSVSLAITGNNIVVPALSLKNCQNVTCGVAVKAEFSAFGSFGLILGLGGGPHYIALAGLELRM